MAEAGNTIENILRGMKATSETLKVLMMGEQALDRKIERNSEAIERLSGYVFAVAIACGTLVVVELVLLFELWLGW